MNTAIYINTLRKTDKNRLIFGAGLHQYKTHKQSPEAISRLEILLKKSLPDDFRSFLLETGSGAGPYYGILGIDSIIEESCDLGVPLEYEIPFNIPCGSIPEFSEIYNGLSPYKLPEKMGGYLIICHQGCTIWSILVYDGPYAGTVWDLASYTSGEFLVKLPTQAPDILNRDLIKPNSLINQTRPVSFREWYLDWLVRVGNALAMKKKVSSFWNILRRS